MNRNDSKVIQMVQLADEDWKVPTINMFKDTNKNGYNENNMLSLSKEMKLWTKLNGNFETLK